MDIEYIRAVLHERVDMTMMPATASVLPQQDIAAFVTGQATALMVSGRASPVVLAPDAIHLATCLFMAGAFVGLVYSHERGCPSEILRAVKPCTT